MPAINLLTE